MKVFSFVCLILGAWIAPATANAQDLVVGFVDLPALIDKSPQALEAGDRLEKEFAPRQQALQQGRAELDLKKNKLQTESLVMSETERSELELDIRKLERRLKREEQDFREELNIKKNNEFKKVREVVLQAILKFANTGEYDLILSEGVVFAHNRIDITQKIIDIMADLDIEQIESADQ
ncbi:MAG: OmpH family outer membrane protein [Pseudomonadota bacterium]